MPSTSDHQAEPTMSRGDVARRNAYLKEFIPAMVLYVVAITSVSTMVDDDSQYRWVWMLVPMVPLLWVVRAVARDLRRADEYSRLIQLQGMAVGFGVAMAASLTIGFLGIAEVTTPIAGWVPFSAGMAAWAVTSARLSGMLRLRR